MVKLQQRFHALLRRNIFIIFEIRTFFLNHPVHGQERITQRLLQTSPIILFYNSADTSQVQTKSALTSATLNRSFSM